MREAAEWYRQNFPKSSTWLQACFKNGKGLSFEDELQKQFQSSFKTFPPFLQRFCIEHLVEESIEQGVCNGTHHAHQVTNTFQNEINRLQKYFQYANHFTNTFQKYEKIKRLWTSKVFATCWPSDKHLSEWLEISLILTSKVFSLGWPNDKNLQLIRCNKFNSQNFFLFLF